MRIGHVFIGFLVTGMLGLATLTYGQAQAPSMLLIKGATVIDGLSDEPLRDRSLLIEGNTIRDLLPSDAAAPAGAQVLDLSGKFIIPGLFDSHVHWEEYMGELYVNHGVTSVIALGNMPKALRERSQDAGDIPRFFHSGGRLQFSEKRRGGRHPPGDTDLAPERTRSGVVPLIQRQAFPRLCDRGRRSPQGGLRCLWPYR